MSRIEFKCRCCTYLQPTTVKVRPWTKQRATTTHLSLWLCGESTSFVLPSFHVQRLTRSGRTHFRSGDVTVSPLLTPFAFTWFPFTPFTVVAIAHRCAVRFEIRKNNSSSKFRNKISLSCQTTRSRDRFLVKYSLRQPQNATLSARASRERAKGRLK